MKCYSEYLLECFRHPDLHSHPTQTHTLTLLYLLVLVVARWLLVRVLLYVTRGWALWSVGARYRTVLLAHVATAGTSLG